MTIEERIKEARREGNFTAYVFTESELNDLLEKVAKEQRELCNDAFMKCKYPLIQGSTAIRNANSPLNGKQP